MAYKPNIDSIFSSHPTDTGEKGQWFHERIRNGAKLLAKDWELFVPDSPEKILAIRKLQVAMLLALSALEQYGDSEPEA